MRAPARHAAGRASGMSLTSPTRALSRRVDWCILALLATIGLAALLPARGTSADAVGGATTVAIGLLFFVYGARLSPRAAFSGLRHWRLHLPILCFTFVVFPALGLVVTTLPASVLSADLAAGLLFLCVLPSTVQSAVAFTLQLMVCAGIARRWSGPAVAGDQQQATSPAPAATV